MSSPADQVKMRQSPHRRRVSPTVAQAINARKGNPISLRPRRNIASLIGGKHPVSPSPIDLFRISDDESTGAHTRPQRSSTPSRPLRGSTPTPTTTVSRAQGEPDEHPSTPPSNPRTLATDSPSTPLSSKKSPSKRPFSHRSPSNSNLSPQSPESKKGRYEYKPLQSLMESRSAMDKEYVNVYGVFFMATRINANSNVIELRDESTPNFGAKITITERASTIPLPEFGDVVRIHRLMKDYSSTRVFDAKSVAVFKGFGPFNKDVAPKSMADNFTLNPQDHARRRELDTWLCERLLQSSLNAAFNSPRYTCLVGQVIAVVGPDEYSRASLAICDGTDTELEFIDPMQQFPNAVHLLRRTEDLSIIVRAKQKKGIGYVTIYDARAQTCATLPLDSIVVINNVEIKTNSRYPTFKDIHLHGSDMYGRCLRIANPESILAQRIKQRVQEFLSGP